MTTPTRLLFCCLLFFVFGASAQDEVRIALVLGNSNYSKEIGALPNPANDASDMAETLKSLGFEVLYKLNSSYAETRDMVRSFHEKVSNGPKGKVVSLFYYAGHGVQYQNENYIVPIDAKVEYEDDITRTCFPVQRMIVSNMERTGSRISIIILDACRNNPFPAATRSLGHGGLGELSARGSFVAFATAPGSVASDGSGRNGLYTQELLKAMRKPGLLIEQVFKEVRRNVLHLSNEKQYTWDSSNIIGDFYFIPQGTMVAEPVVIASNTIVNTNPTKEVSRSSVKALNIDPAKLGKELSDLTNSSIPFAKRKEKSAAILNYFVVPYAATQIMIGPRIDERLRAEKLLERLITLPDSEVTVLALETSDSGRIIEVSVEIN